MSEISEKILTEEQRQACDEIADLINAYKAAKPVTLNVQDMTATISLQLVKAKDVPFGKQKRFYKVFFEVESPTANLHVMITDLTAKATQNNYNKEEDTLIISGHYEEDLIKKLGEQLYSAMYFSGHNNYIKREIQPVTIEKDYDKTERN